MIADPRKRLFNGAEISIIYPTSKQVAEAIRDAIVAKYLELTQQSGREER
jgi:DNA-binding cell septation regulator SpoVG